MKSKQIHPLVQKIASPVTGMIMLGFGLLAQAPHTQDVFWELGHDRTGYFMWVVSWFCALTIDGAVMYYVANGNHLPSYIFTGVSIAMNLVYYHLHGHSLLQLEVWLVSGSLPATITFYSHLIADGSYEQDGNASSSMKWFASLQMGFSKLRSKAQDASTITLLSQPAQTLAEDPMPVLVAQSAQVLATPAPVLVVDPPTQPVAEEAAQPTLGDDLDQRILACIASGHTTAYAISKQLGVVLTTLQRKGKDGAYVGRLPALVAAQRVRYENNKYVLAGN